MFGKRHKQIIKNIIEKLSNDSDKQLIDDYFAYHTVLISFYARNVFRINSNWINLKKSYDVNYNYIRENNTSYKLTDIEKELKCRLNIIDKIFENKDIENKDIEIIEINDFIDYIKYCMKHCIDDIGIPFKIMSYRIRNIIEKYKNNENIMNYRPKSKKINYEVYDKLLFS